MDLQAVVLSFNHPDLTARCVQSCLKFLKPNQIQLVHNGSFPHFVDRLLKEFPDITHHKLNPNRGFTGGANFALQKAYEKSDWALFVTNDCELMSLNSHLDNLESGLYAPLIYRRKTDRVDSFGGILNSRSGRLSHISYASSDLKAGETFYVPGTAFLLDKSSFEKVGLFDERLGTYWEDVDFSLRCHDKGVPLKQTKEFIFRHGIGKTCHKHSYYTNYLYQRNRIRVCRKWKAGSEFRFFKDTLKHCAQKAQRGHWPEAWRRAKAHLDA